METTIFVFGSNLKGIHGAGAAKAAVQKHGALRGQGVGLQGNSYAIPTKETPYITLSLENIGRYVKDFLEFAKNNTSLVFMVTPIGCGLAGYTPEQIAPMFRGASDNVQLPDVFVKHLKGENDDFTYVS